MRYTFLKFCALGLMALVLSCSDDSDNMGPGDQDGDFYIRFKLDGEEKEYKVLTSAVFHYEDNKATYYAEMIAGLTATSGVNSVTIFLYNNEPYKTGVNYDLKNEVQVSGVAMPQIIVVLFDENGESYTAQFLPADWFDFDDDADLAFTKLTDKVAEGTFSARVFSPMPERTERNITDGEFRLSVVDLK